MNYLHHASKHISSSHELSGRKEPIRFFTLIVLLIVLVLCYVIFGRIIGNIIFGIKNYFAPKTDVFISLTPSAYDAWLSALEIENNSLKELLINYGITFPRGNEILGKSEMLSKMRVSASRTGADEFMLIGTNTAAQTISNFPLKAVSNDESGLNTNWSSSTNSIPNTEIERSNVQNNMQESFSQETDIQKFTALSNSLIPLTRSLKGGEILASVLVRPPLTPYDALIINAGMKESVEVGDQVYAFSGFPIGEVVETKQNRSTVRLLSAPGIKTEVLIGTSTIAVTAEGKGGGNFFLKLPKVTEIKKGDVVARNYLPPEVFSSIETVDSNDGEAYVYAYFKLPVHLNSLVYVLIKKNSY